LHVTHFADGIIHNICSKAHFTDLGGFGKTVLVENDGHFISESVRLDGGLVALANVVSALTEPQWQHTQVPYMQSVLTRLLKVSN
jgi:kinesin family protein 4/21/27